MNTLIKVRGRVFFVVLTAALLWSSFATADSRNLTSEFEHLVSRLEEERDNIIGHKYGHLSEVEIEGIEFKVTPLTEALEEISDEVAEQTGAAINYTFSDSIDLTRKVNLSLRKIPASKALMFTINQVGLDFSISNNQVYIYDESDSVIPSEVKRLENKLRLLNQTIDALTRQLDALKLEEAAELTKKRAEEIIFENVSFRSEKLAVVLDYLNQGNKKSQGAKDAIPVVPLARSEEITQEISFESERASLQQILDVVVQNTGWYIMYDHKVVVISPRPFYDKDEGARIRKISEQPLAPHKVLNEEQRELNGLLLRVVNDDSHAENSTLKCELINNTKHPVYFVSTTMLMPDYIICDVNENGERIENLFLTDAMGPAPLYPELLPGTMTPFSVDIDHASERFQIGVRVGRKRYGVAKNLDSKVNRLLYHSGRILWTKTVERPGRLDENGH